MIQVFDNNDQDYLEWLEKYAEGFVLNTRRRGDPEYIVLHRTTCPSIYKYSKIARPGSFTEMTYIKVCSDSLSELSTWAKNHGRNDGSFSKKCSKCKPL